MTREEIDRRHDQRAARLESLRPCTAADLRSLCEAKGLAKSGDKASLTFRLLDSEGLLD